MAQNKNITKWKKGISPLGKRTRPVVQTQNKNINKNNKGFSSMGKSPQLTNIPHHQINPSKPNIIPTAPNVIPGGLPFGTFVQTTNMMGVFIGNIRVDTNVPTSWDVRGDWVGIYTSNGVLSGAQQWDTSQCNNGVCSLNVYGQDTNIMVSQDQAISGDILKLAVYKYSEDKIYMIDRLVGISNIMTGETTKTVNFGSYLSIYIDEIYVDMLNPKIKQPNQHLQSGGKIQNSRFKGGKV